ncbi:glycosyltransferase 87 family protein [Dokdonia ponticola]|uniref:Glycosyltransferase 87 family protein n=1 Tax=Dokdonia ponticola TaxID=2041041 RepID=A0ABV9HV57_9FLAO
MIARIWKYHKLPLLFSVFSLAFYGAFAYDLVRSDFTKLLTLYTTLFFLFYKIVQLGKTDFWLLAFIAFVSRLIFLPAIPNLSQDFYRFIWDGRLLLEGFNPYLTTPLSYVESGTMDIIAQANQLYAGMGTLNGSHYTNYPPINQLCFAIAGFFSSDSISDATIILRLIIIIADMGIIILGKKLLERMGMPIHAIFWYALNPFIIIEMTGNLHFESVMLFFVIASLYLLHKGKWIWSAVLLALSISVKLLPLLFLPLLFQFLLSRNNTPNQHLFLSWKGWKNAAFYYLIVLGTVALTFAPFLTGAFAENFGASIALWFQKFEFNASIYYIIRWYGYQTVGWNIIGDVGPLLPRYVVGFLLLLAFFRKNKTLKATITAILLGISFYFLLSTTVHPWYVATPLILCVFTKYRFPLVWSFTIILSYSAYGPDGFKENLGLVALEYLIVLGVFLWEVFRKEEKPILV